MVSKDRKAIALVGFFRTKYLQNSVDLLDGLDLIEQFMANFGMRFEFVLNGATEVFTRSISELI